MQLPKALDRMAGWTLCALVLCACATKAAESSVTPDAGPDAGLVDAADAAIVDCPTIGIADGPVQGKASSAGPAVACTYMGIPFAAPPTGALRWKAPRPPAPWTAPRPSSPGSGCPQGLSPFGGASDDEDCLTVNVWVPAAPPRANAPVMVFVYGGIFEYGSGTAGLYDGTKLAAATGNVVVTLNYRLGAFGFLSSPALRAEDPTHPSAGNYGLEDQIQAFAWVKKNIAAFGGDASNVTIFGESAGGTSMFVHLLSPRSKGLFEHVIVESGWAPYGTGAITTQVADENGATFATGLGCDAGPSLLSCLRAKSADDVLASTVPVKGGGVQAPTGVDWLPVIDGFVLPGDPMMLFASGSFTKVPTLLGNNENEGTLLVLPAAPTGAAAYLAFEEAQFKGHGAAIVAQYAASSYGGSFEAASADALTDGSFVCPARRVARAIAGAGTPTFRYDFDHAIKFILPGLGAFHGSELLFVFGNPLEGTALSPTEMPLSQEMMGYWGAMAASGDPNGGGRFSWPRYVAGSETQIVLDLTLSTQSGFKKPKCDFWDGLGPW